jgi:hypothetical protein
VAIAIALTAAPAPVWAAAQKEGEQKKPRVNAPPAFKRSGASSGEVGFLKLSPFNVTVLDERKVTARLVIGLDFETTGGEREDKLVAAIPRLQANYVDYLTRNGAATIKGGKLQVDLLKAQLQRITDETVGKDIGKVLIREALKH